jgi:hypothetical protein
MPVSITPTLSAAAREETADSRQQTAQSRQEQTRPDKGGQKMHHMHVPSSTKMPLSITPTLSAAAREDTWCATTKQDTFHSLVKSPTYSGQNGEHLKVHVLTLRPDAKHPFSCTSL